MTDQSLTYDPEIIEILANIAADERSTLLRIPPRQAFREMMSPAHAVSARMAGLSSLERHLLERHRDELGLILRSICYQALASDAFISDGLSGYTDIDSQLPTPDPALLHARVERIQESSILHGSELAILPLLAQCSTPGRVADLSITKLCASTLRVSPSDTTRIYMGLDQFRNGNYQGAIHAFELVLNGAPKEADASMAWENIGSIRSEQARLRQAYDAYHQSALAHDSRIDPAIGSFLMALQMGDRRRAEFESERLADSIPEGHPSISHFVYGCLKRRSEGRWKPTREGVRLLRSLVDKLDPVSMRFANVLR